MDSPEIRLACGPAPWLQAAHGAVTVLAVGGLLAAGLGPARTLAAVALALAVHATAALRLRREARYAPQARLGWDCEPCLVTGHGVEPAAWAPGGFESPWLLVLPLRERSSGRIHYCLATRARNSPDDFRRARVLLRLRAQGEAAARDMQA